MNGYVPSVGELCRMSVKGSIHSYDVTLLGLDGDEAWVKHANSTSSEIIDIDRYELKPMPTKADVEREQLIALLSSYAHAEIVETAEKVQTAGFTIPNKVKRSSVKDVIDEVIDDISWMENGCITDALCNLLGDLVENDS